MNGEPRRESSIECVMDKLKVAIVQLTSTNDVGENERALLTSLEQAQAAAARLDLILFPENVWFLRLGEGEKFPDFGAPEQQPFRDHLQQWVDRTGTAVVLGSVPLRDHHGAGPGVNASSLGGAEVKPFAASVVFEPGRGWHAPYSKLHLFDVDVAGHRPVRESDHLSAGNSPAIWVFQGWRFGCAICYDVRFSELFAQYAAQDVDTLFLPSAFLVPTGRQHWEILVRARAIESQAYMLAPEQSGDHLDRKTGGSAVGAAAMAPAATPRKTYGRSMIVDPWGRILAAAAAEKSGIEILVAEMTKEELRRVRGQIPMKSHRRLAPHRGSA